MLDDCCAHIEALKRYLDRNGLYLTGVDENVFVECERCELDYPITELYAVPVDADEDIEDEEDE